MSERDPLQSLWKTQTQEDFTMSLADIRTRATRFQSRIRTRNWIEYAAAAFVVACFANAAVTVPSPIAQAGAVLIVLGALYVCWKLHQLGHAASASDFDAAQSLAAFHRAELTRQRTALNTVWSWYIAPFVPGMLVFLAGISFEPSLEAPLFAKLIIFAIGAGFMTAVLWGVAWINAQAVKRLDAEIAAIDKARE